MRLLFLVLLPLFTLFGEDSTTPTPEAEPIIEEVTSPAIPTEMYQKQFYRTFILILIIVVGSFTLIWYLRKFAKDRPFQVNHKKNIKILERRQISPNTFLYHLQIGTKQVVISESKYEVRVITNLDWEEPEGPL